MTAEILKMTAFSGFDPDQQRLLAVFETLGIAHETWSHPPIFTVEEGIKLNLPERIPGQHGKSLLLTNDRDELWLVVAAENTRVDLKKLYKTLETRRFSFAKPEIMVAVLGVKPGSATPFALMNDIDRRVRVVVDSAFTAAEYCVFHPLKNNASTVVSSKDLLRFITHLGYTPQVLELT